MNTFIDTSWTYVSKQMFNMENIILIVDVSWSQFMLVIVSHNQMFENIFIFPVKYTNTGQGSLDEDSQFCYTAAGLQRNSDRAKKK